MEPTNIDFKNIWKQQQTEQPDSKELLDKLKHFKSKNLRKILITNILLIVTSILIGLIWFHYQPQLLSTKIGIILIILAMTVYLAAYNRMFNFFRKTDQTQSNSEYLQSLYVLKTRQRFMETNMISIYFIMLSAGIGLYMYEYTSRMTVLSAILAYSLTLAWIGFNWFYIRPKTIKKQQTGLNDLITRFENMNRQLKG